jgi:drug/metabolite transporter (DMT)-like permease
VGVVFFQAVTNRFKWLGLGIAFIGLIVLLEVNPVSIISIDPLGFICMMAATLCYAVGSQLSKRLKGLSMYQITFGTLLCTMFGSGSVAFSIEPTSFLQHASFTNITALIGLGIFGTGIAYILYYFMIQKGSPEFATMVTYFVPVSAIIWGYTLLNEKINWSLLIGLAFILGGVFMASKNQSKKAAFKQIQDVKLIP